MKKLSLLFIAGLLCSEACTAQFEIQGNVGNGNAPVVLMAKKEILAQTEMKNGKFLLKGKVDQPTAANLVLKGRKDGTLIFLEKGKYSVSLNPEDSSWNVQGGGKLQQLHREYRAMLQDAEKTREKYIAGLYKAREENNRGSVLIYRSDIRKMDSVCNAIENHFLSLHPDSPLSAYYIYTNLNDLNYSELKEKYDLLGKGAKESEWGKVVSERCRKLQEIVPGNMAPDFTLETPEGKTLSLHKVKSKVKIVDFWASWCGPCRANNPALVKLYKEYKDAGLEIIGVSLDAKKEPWEKAIKADQLSWPQTSSLKGWECPVAAQYLVSGIPALFIIDENNRIVKIRPSDSEIEETLKSLLH